MIQGVNRFLLDTFYTDWQKIAPQNPFMERSMATKLISTLRCGHCNHEGGRPENWTSHTLSYPSKTLGRSQGRGTPKVSFSQILKSSFERQEPNKAYCSSCRRYQPLHITRQIQRMPTVLMINANAVTPDARQIWSTPNWLPQEIGVIVDQGQFYCYQDQDLKLHVQRGVFNVQIYELIGVVSEISSGENQKPHLVSVINSKLGYRPENDAILTIG